MARTRSKNSAIAVPPMDAMIILVCDTPVCSQMKRDKEMRYRLVGGVSNERWL
jgi:hypothetical protein